METLVVMFCNSGRLNVMTEVDHEKLAILSKQRQQIRPLETAEPLNFHP